MRTIFVIRFAVAIVLGLATLSTTAMAQAVSGNIDGTVTDSSGAAVPAASISIRDVDRGTEFRSSSNTEGNFGQTHLLAGHYQVKVEHEGFAAFVADVTVQVDATTRVDAALKPAGTQSTVTVTDESPLLMTDRAEVSTTLTSAEVENLPVLDRNVTNLLLVIPGAQLNSWQHAASENPQQGIQANVNGQFFTANGFLLDGTENQSAILGIAVINPNIDSLQDFKVTTSNYDAEFGSASGALIQATTAAGTNKVHGTLFEFLRNDVTNAADPFTLQNPPIRWNQFGGSVGAPIRRNSMFAFFDYQGTRRRTGGSLITTVPTAAERSGDLTALLGDYICMDGSTSSAPCGSPLLVPTTEGATTAARAGMVFNPATGNADGTERQAYTQGGQPNIVPVAAPMANLLNDLPLPNSGSDIFNNYVSSGSQHFDSNQFDGRVDLNVFSSYHLFARYTLADFNNYSPAAFGNLAGGPSSFGFSGDSIDRNQSAAAGMDKSLSPTLQTDVRLGFYRYRIRVQPNGVGTTPATDAGLPGLNTGTPETSGMPAFYINGSGGFNFGYALGINQCNCPLKETESHFQIVNNWTKQLGNHAVKWGADLRRAQQQRIPSDSHRSGEISFNDSTTGSAEADTLAAGQASTGSALGSFLIGDPSSFARYFTGAGFHPGLRQNRLFFFGQDSWRITPRLTLNYGVRWEDYLPQTAAKPGGAGSFDPTTGEVLAAGIGSVPANMGVKAYNLGFAPRVGVSYQFQKSSVVRAGVGRSFNPSGLGAIFGQGADYNPPVTNPQSVNQTNPYSPDFNLLAGPPAVPNPPVGSTGRYPLPDGISVYYFTYPSDSYRIPEAYFWNLAVETEFTNTLAFEVAYVGNVGRHLFLSINENQAVPGPGDFDPRRPFFGTFGLEQALYQTCNCDTSQYNALQSKLQKRFSHGLDFLLTYTWSKAMDNSEGGGGFANNYDIRASHGPASWDRTNEVTLEHNWDLPFGHDRKWRLGGNKIADAIAGGWRLSGTHNFGSGLPFTPTVSNAPLLNTDFNYVTADVVGDPILSNPTRDLWYDPAAFTEPQQPYRNGTAHRDSLRGPKLALSNLSIAKNLLPMEGKSLEFRAEAFNVFNHVNLGLPNSTIDSLGAGQITYVQAPMRQMQFALHLRF
jgi:Carboxypeptidase regulatory-like domain/TonB dependent receptor